MSEAKIEVLTAREALFEIRRIADEARSDVSAWGALKKIERAAEEGLDRTQLVNFELSDQLADRLAAAIKVLEDVDWERDRNSELADAAHAALALPPDIEAMVERRR